ncbi:MAG TPA: ATP synthase F0 subunit B [Clostridiales bacterium]|jgi:F-type H+-transporting ATPase subunit b|nr:ATP synthase F0 subunit B [Clostridiales bacterium]
MLKAPLVGFSWTIVFQIVNTLILFYFLRKYLFVPVTGIMESREKSIVDSLQDAERLSEEAENYKQQYYNMLQSAQDEGKELIEKARKNADEKSEKILKEAKEETLKLKQKAEEDIRRDRKKAVNEIKDEISTLAILAASKILENEVDEAKSKTLVSKFIEQVGDEQWQN